ncbi:hypothetical protein LTR91_010370 [Friedmanniomyces endolithicus]|uniref:Uncharacterized protein n=1 Tax=Friedmanniomyces endolithicus TaxID=329885 RepID=A0AAN6KJ53_9PEZI|nr:hypothetical protein LTR57_013279 [Friedmanniomyces endolithicus]KAK0956333.1 hypothetical protein LTS01_022905 [Friedmanniomyces endolithicus]KAK0986099.1 hypothetical protein LTR91_010370 [Friedmanniomyces endolithicus]KAK1037158.1 hypothetical protein LTS16_013153 [Friedmanniomyces endolithicus]KAK1067442.1 hypothetical protein LTR33_011359 [Friedmanniomyces endolithicus]
MAKRNLLICFDAFGTLFKPKRPIAQQYGEVARSLGLSGFTDDQVSKSFSAAFKHETKENPNFGKSNGLNSTTWWTNIIQNTFNPLVGPSPTLTHHLAPALLYRFSSEEAYTLLPHVLPLLQDLRTHPPHGIDRIAVGVITNSDDRVPSVLTSLGLRVSPLTYGSGGVKGRAPVGEVYDVDFTVMSYDVGFEKPDWRVFGAAEEMLASLPVAVGTEPGSWVKVFVGDEFEKDVVGAREAGWCGVLLREAASGVPDGLKEVDERTPGALLLTLRQSGDAVSVSSFSALAKALGVVPQTDGSNP